jgi:hypothetical protein
MKCERQGVGRLWFFGRNTSGCSQDREPTPIIQTTASALAPQSPG